MGFNQDQIINKEKHLKETQKCVNCKVDGIELEAVYNTMTIFGVWAYLCESCSKKVGIGLGQKLSSKEKDDEK